MSDYATYLAGKCDEWRTKYPRRSAELRIIVRRWLGIQPTAQGKLALETTVQVENEVVRVMQGWPTEYDWRPTPQGGADRALPTGDRDE